MKILTAFMIVLASFVVLFLIEGLAILFWMCIYALTKPVVKPLIDEFKNWYSKRTRV